MLKQLLAAGAGIALLAGGTAFAGGHGRLAERGQLPLLAQLQAGRTVAPGDDTRPGPAAQAPHSAGLVPATVVAVGSGTLTIEAPAAALPAQLTAVTTGGSKVDATLPLASQARIVADASGAPDGLAPGERVRVQIQGGAVTEVIIAGSGGEAEESTSNAASQTQPAAAVKGGKGARHGGDDRGEGRD